jgi:hypothetical protein
MESMFSTSPVSLWIVMNWNWDTTSKLAIFWLIWYSVRSLSTDRFSREFELFPFFILVKTQFFLFIYLFLLNWNIVITTGIHSFCVVLFWFFFICNANKASHIIVTYFPLSNTMHTQSLWCESNFSVLNIPPAFRETILQQPPPLYVSDEVFTGIGTQRDHFIQ